MKTRLRVQRSKEDELHPAAHADRPFKNNVADQEHRPSEGFGDIFAMQRTHGNAYMQRYLGALAAGKPAPGLISRDTPKNGNPKPASDDTAATQPACYLTLTTADGKAIRGDSKRKGREGQIECLSFQRQNTEKANRLGRDREGEKSKTEWREGKKYTTSNEQIDAVFMKVADGSSPTLSDAVARGLPVKARFDFVKVDKEGRETVYLSVELDEAMLSSYQTVGGEKPSEFIGISAGKSSTHIPEVAEQPPDYAVKPQ